MSQVYGLEPKTDRKRNDKQSMTDRTAIKLFKNDRLNKECAYGESQETEDDSETLSVLKPIFSNRVISASRCKGDKIRIP